jgi:TonB family protein
VKILLRIFSFLLSCFSAVMVSFFFFIIIPLLHDLFGVNITEKDKGPQRRIVAEMINKPKTEPPKQNPMRIRKVSTAQDRGTNRSSQMALKFSPDLMADAGGDGASVALQNNELNAEIFDEGQTDEPAQQVSSPQLSYPDRLREAGVTGIVEARFTITYEGKASFIEITRSPHALLSNEVRKTLTATRFLPAKNKGIPVNVKAKKIFEFNLD